jgi:hypothetical protein
VYKYAHSFFAGMVAMNIENKAITCINIILVMYRVKLERKKSICIQKCFLNAMKEDIL